MTAPVDAQARDLEPGDLVWTKSWYQPHGRQALRTFVVLSWRSTSFSVEMLVLDERGLTRKEWLRDTQVKRAGRVER